MEIRRTKHAVYDLKSHTVWIPEYRKQILTGEISGYIKEVFKKYPELRKQLWAGELWNDGYFEYQTHEDDTSPLKMFQ